MAKLEDLRKLKDQATKAVEKRQYVKAAELYLEVASREAPVDRPDWQQRAGDAFQRGGDKARAIEALAAAADGYSGGGFLLKAIAVLKMVQRLDPARAGEAQLAELYARRDAGGGTSFASKPAPAPLRPPVAARPAAVIPPPALDARPLHAVLGGRITGQFPALDAPAAPQVYEIDLDTPSVEIEVEVASAGGPPPKIPLFSSLPEAELQELITRMTLLEPAPGDVIVREGERGGSLFVLAAGEARVLAGGVEVARLGSGAFFGEVGLLTDDPRTATVEAVNDSGGGCSVLELPRELAWEVGQRSPEVMRTLVSFLRDRLLERLLHGSPLFACLSPPDARALAAEFVFLEIDAGATPVKQGERSPALFFLMSGAAEAVRDGERVAELGAGDVFGELSLLLRAPASADVRALRRSWALSLPRQRFQEIMLGYPQVLAYVSELGESRRSMLGRDGHVDLS